jgi:hypothetical protein
MSDKKTRSNDEIVRRLHEKDPLEGLGCYYKAYPVRLFIQDMKNYYEDYFGHASRHVHFIHWKARSRLPNEVVARVEQSLKDQIKAATTAVEDAIEQCEVLMKSNGITLEIHGTPSCSAPLTHTAKVISPLTNRYIQLIEKTDYVLRALDALFTDEVITMEEYNVRRGLLKGIVKRFYYSCRTFDEGLRARMDTAHRQEKYGSDSKADDAGQRRPDGDIAPPPPSDEKPDKNPPPTAQAAA